MMVAPDRRSLNLDAVVDCCRFACHMQACWSVISRDTSRTVVRGSLGSSLCFECSRTVQNVRLHADSHTTLRSATSHGVHTGFATFRLSLTPVTGSINSCQLTGTICSPNPPSPLAITTPNSFRAVEQ